MDWALLCFGFLWQKCNDCAKIDHCSEDNSANGFVVLCTPVQFAVIIIIVINDTNMSNGNGSSRSLQ